MRTKSRPRPTGDSYFALVKKFPLVPIGDDEHHAQASMLIDELLRQKLDAGESAYLDVLSELVHRYEEQHHSLPSVSQGALVRYLLNEKNVSQAQLARAVEISPSVISAVLTGARELSKANILTLAKYFGVSPNVFLTN